MNQTSLEERLKYLEQLEAEERALDEKQRNADLALSQRRIEAARRDYRRFCEHVLKDETTGDTIKLAAIHRQWIDHIDYCWARGLHCAILAPFGHGKTQLIGVGIPLFAFGRNPKIRIKFVCANDEIAQQRVGAIKNYIENDVDYKEVFPHVQPSDGEKWTNHQLYLRRPTMAKDPSIDAKGITSSIMGSRADIVIFDDVNDRKNSIEQPATREKVWANFRSVFLSRLEPTARVVSVATRWHQNDIVGCLLEDDKMRARWGFLVQRINETFTGIDCEYYYPDAEGIIARPAGDLDRLFEEYELGMYDGAKEA